MLRFVNQEMKDVNLRIEREEDQDLLDIPEFLQRERGERQRPEPTTRRWIMPSARKQK